MAASVVLNQIRKDIFDSEALLSNDSLALEEKLSLKEAEAILQKDYGDWVIVQIISRDFYLYSFLADKEQNKEHLKEQFLEWNYTIPSGWGLCISCDKGKKTASIEPPLSDIDLKGVEPLFFLRYFDGYPKDKASYIEFNQAFLHVAGVHWVESESAYCSLDECGDFDPQIIVSREEKPKLVLIKKQTLDLYLAVQSKVLIRNFELRRCKDWVNQKETSRNEQVIETGNGQYVARKLQINSSPIENSAVFIRGGQFLAPSCAAEDIANQVYGDKPEKQYASFIIHDWKNGKVIECSAEPGHTANYFTESPLPFETSPAFFSAAVLLKYRNDPNKYEVTERQIYCRGAWQLKTFDINDAGQVHTYICYLAQLPYAEQLYWKSYNEAPKGGLSKRAIKTDFKAEFDTTHNPMASLKDTLLSFPDVQVDGEKLKLWSPKNGNAETVFQEVHPVVTEQAKEWDDFIQALSNATIEGLQKDALRRILGRLSIAYDPKLGSIKLLRRLIEGIGAETDVLDEIFSPLEQLYSWRSKKAHGGPRSVQNFFKQEYSRLITEIDSAFYLLSQILSQTDWESVTTKKI